MARSYAPLAIVASVPITPMTPRRVARTAARTPGSITPTTGSSAARVISSMALTSTELHATTSIFTSRCTSHPVTSSANRRISSSGFGP
jgi:hypothetical protein